MTKAKNRPKISIVIPAYKAESFISRVVRMRINELEKLQLDYEIIVVIDGKSYKAAESLAKIRNRRLKVFHYQKNMGKGFAVKFGMLRADGDYIGYVDAGYDICSGNITRMVKAMTKTGADAVIPSKWHKESNLHYPKHRQLISRIYNNYLNLLFRFGLNDTQVGAKLYSRRLVKSVMPRILVKRFAFEAELLAVAKHLGINSFVEVPVKIKSDKYSTVKFKDGLHSFWDIAAVFYRMFIMRYYDRSPYFFKKNTKVELNNLRLVGE